MNIITNNTMLNTVALAALYNVEDPEIGLNVVDLGLIYQIDFDERNKEIFITMTLTTPYCPMGDTIRSAAVRALEQAFPGHHVNISVVFDPPWSHDRISPEGQEFLNR